MNTLETGSEDTHLRAVLPVSISQAVQDYLACSLREKLRCIYTGELLRVVAEEGADSCSSGCGENFASTNIQFKALTTT
jgi:hypothetical protein